MERFKSPKILNFDYTDEYSKDWYRHIFNFNKSATLNRMNIDADDLAKYLNKVSIRSTIIQLDPV